MREKALNTVTLILNLVIEKFKYTDGMMESLIKVIVSSWTKAVKVYKIIL